MDEVLETRTSPVWQKVAWVSHGTQREPEVSWGEADKAQVVIVTDQNFQVFSSGDTKQLTDQFLS